MDKRPAKRRKNVHNIFIDDQATYSDNESDEEGE
jgi:hypothetical protein